MTPFGHHSGIGKRTHRVTDYTSIWRKRESITGQKSATLQFKSVKWNRHCTQTKNIQVWTWYFYFIKHNENQNKMKSPEMSANYPCVQSDTGSLVTPVMARGLNLVQDLRSHWWLVNPKFGLRGSSLEPRWRNRISNNPCSLPSLHTPNREFMSSLIMNIYR